MTVQELALLINTAVRPEFDHVSKTYHYGIFLNIAYGKSRHTFNLDSNYSVSYHILQSYRK